MSSSDTAAAKKAAGQLQQDLGDMHGSHDLRQSGHTTFQHGKGIQDADKETGASGFAPVAGAKDFVKEKLDDRKEV